MDIYFCGSIRAGREDVVVYNELISYLKNYGNVLTEHIGDKRITETGGEGIDKGLSDAEIHDRDIGWIVGRADVIIAEITKPSLGVGYEIGRAIGHGKRILCLYRLENGKKLSAMISGCREIKKGKYETIEQAKKIIDNFFKNRG